METLPPTPESTNSSTEGFLSQNFLRSVFRAAWWGVLLGLLLQLIQLAIQFYSDRVPSELAIIASAVQKISWSGIVCAALAAAQSIVKMRVNLMGLAGLFAAPCAFIFAKALQKATQAMLGTDSISLSFDIFLPALIKGIEYGLLAVLISIIVKATYTWRAAAFTGVIVGFCFASLLILLVPNSENNLQRYVLETLHPTGCALILFVSAKVNQRLWLLPANSA